MGALNYLRRISDCSLAEGDVSLGAGFEVSVAHSTPTQLAIGLLLMVQDISSELLLKHHACLPEAVSPP